MAKAPSTEQMSAEMREKGRQAFLEPSEVKQRLYHGTTKDIAQFDPTQAGSKTGNPNAALGTFLSDNPSEANRYATQWGTEGGNVMPVHVQAKNPYHMSYKEFNDLAMGAWNRRMQDPDYDPNARLKFSDREGHKKAAKKLQQYHDAAVQDTIKRRNELIKEGHDSIITKIGGNKEYIMFHPHQIKSAIGNRGTYDTTNPDVNKAQGGAVHLAAGKSVGQMSAELREKGRQAFLKPSEVKQRMYHGTGQDIRQFKPKQAGASFVTPNPKFAHDFADLSESWMKRNAGTILTGEQIERAKDLTAKEMTKHQTRRNMQSIEREIALIGSPQAHAFTQTLYANKLAEQLPSAQNIMPVHVQAKKPFDYENPKHIHAVRTMLHKLGHTQHIDDFDTAMRGEYAHAANWQTIESKPVQQAIRALGHDSFWVKEGGVKNLGVYNPGAIKSAIGNRGTYDTEDYDINKAQGGAVHLAAGKSVEPPPYRVYRGTTAGTMLSNAPYTHFAHKPEVAAGAERGYLSPEFLQSVGMDPALARVPKDLAVYPADVRIRKPAGPKEVNKHAPNAKTVQEAFPILHKAGYDGYVDDYQVVPFEHHQIKSAFEKAQGGAVNPVKLKEGKQPPYQDPKTSKIDDWIWHPMERIRQELSARRELPEHVTPYADYMREMNAKAQAGELTPRDLVKAYTITQSSIGRGGLSHSMATSRGMKLPNTGGEVRPEGAFAEWLGSPMGQKYLDASMRGEDHPEAREDLRAKFAPFGKQNAQVEAMQYATKTLPQRVASANYAVTGGKDDYRKFAGNIRGIAGAKSGFIGSLLGRGDLPTLDARQLNLHSLSHPTKTPEGMMSRGKGLGGQEAVDRLIARQDALGYKIPKELAPYAQHLIHHDVWDQRGGTKTTHEDLIKAMRGYADGGDVGEGRIPLDLPKAPVPSRQEMQAIVDRIARQQAGEFVKGASTHNLAGRSLKEFERIQKVPYSLKPTKQLRPTPVYHAQKGDVNIVVPGDLTVSDKMLEHVNDTPIGSQQEGGSQYGEGKLDMPEDKRPFWASGLGAARAFQNKVTKLARLTGEDPRVIAYHLAMASEGNNFAMHLADANLKAIKNSKIAPENVDTFNRIIRAGSKATGSFPDFPGVHLPEESYAAMRKDSEMRKFFNNRMKTPTITKPLGLPNGLDIDWAVSHPELRNMEINMTGHSVGRMKPGAELIPGSAHKTYSHDILGESLGRAPELAPLELSFLDATHFLRQPGQMTSPGAYTRTMSLGAPHQVVDDRYLNMMNDYYTKLRATRGFAKGGNVSMDEMLAHTTLGKKAPNVRNIGANEAPDMKVKQYIPPGPDKGNTLPAGGVDFQPEMPGHQLTQAAPAGTGGPAMPGMPGMPPGAPGMPPGGPGPGMPGMPPPLPRNQPGMPTGKPAGLEPPNIPPPKQKPTGSNILSMTPQGQALAALGPMRKMAEGGGVKRKVEVKPTVKDETLQRKIPEMETAVKALHAGIIDHAEYDRIVAKHKPVKPYDFVPQPASDKDAARALKDAQKAHWRGAEQWPAGRKVGLRLDIPAYERHGVWVNSIHDEEGKDGNKYNTSYGPVSSVKNATFDPTPSKAVRVATGEQNKSPFARIKGELHPMSEDEAVKHMQEHLHHPDWAQVGMDPRRHGFFYDRKTLQPVTHSEHVVQIGPLVLAKKPKYGKRETYSHGGGVTLPPSTEQMRQALSARRSNSKA